MIGWEDIYKMVVAVTPLYVALSLGYGSVKWWHMFKPEHCDAINRFNCYFIIPFFCFDLTSNVNPYRMNYKFVTADIIAKCIIGIVLALWANCSRKGSLSWSITAFSVCSLSNSLIVGVPLLQTMYGQLGVDLVVQASVVQLFLWLITLFFMLELRRARTMIDTKSNNGDSQGPNSIQTGSISDPEENSGAEPVLVIIKPPSLWSIMKIVFFKLANNPIVCSCILGIIWSLVANRWNLKMPSVIEGSIAIMSKASSAVFMFNMGLFMGLQVKIIACGASKTILGMTLRFVVSPASMAIGAVAMGLRGKILSIAVIQAAMPPAAGSFVYAKQYGLHADVLSTTVSFGIMASLPLLIAYYAVLDIFH